MVNNALGRAPAAAGAEGLLPWDMGKRRQARAGARGADWVCGPDKLSQFFIDSSDEPRRHGSDSAWTDSPAAKGGYYGATSA